MKAPSRKASSAHRIVCPFCESGALVSSGPGFARCDSCGLPLLGSTLETLRDMISLPDALGAHPCECGHPEMRHLPYGVFHCPACGSEVLPVEVSGARPQVLDGRLHRAPYGTPSPLEPTRRASA
jgi:ribosomal protein L37AE/L43A